MQQAGYHHANMLAQQLRSSLDQNNQDLLSYIQTAIDDCSQAHTAPSTLPPPTQAVNAATTDTVQVEILTLLRQMQQDMNCPPTTNNTEPAPRTQRGRKTSDDSTWRRRKTYQYCWTHGACAHASPDCKDKAPGHKDKTTFNERMEGANAHCS